ncbi:CGNR zinc finger domain-containing protein [Streptomyces sp. NPDC013455]|uniref:CGNR zinc finger domain-containing protein n=1 Tax=Streptomyces sp. NPDC013455 TaxID=3155605 RepID=UPI00340FC63D
MSATRDPRPLTGEPLALDLLNTRWNTGVVQDLLADTDGLAVWLASNGLAGAHPADAEVLRRLRTARDAVKAAVDGSPAQAAPLVDAVLAHGRIRARLTAGGHPAEEPEFADPAWGPAWLAARNYLELLTRGPDRIRACSGAHCILYFFDTSRNGTRRWCSMAACGNRAKASRHYARAKEN